MTRRPAARLRPRLLASAVTFSAVLAGMSASAAVFGWASWSIGLGSLSGGGWAVVVLVVALGRPGWSGAEKAALRGGADLPGLLEATPKAGERQ
jgi:hypothetical protein